jgi:hypothetical protein
LGGSGKLAAVASVNPPATRIAVALKIPFRI